MTKLIIKLNVAKVEGGHKGKKPYTCIACNKSFSNGKAFGGHKRIHFLKKKENDQPIKEINLQEFNYDDNKPRYHQCTVCPKTFRSKTSFKEHLQKTHIGSSKQDDLVNLKDGEKRYKFFDMSKVLPVGWLKTGKRSLSSRSIGQEQVSVSEDLYQVANDLIVLSEGKRRTEYNLPLKKRKTDQLLPVEETSTDHQYLDTIVGYKYKQKVAFSNNTSSNNIKEEEKVEEISGGYICYRCNKSFVSYQALGGHSSHHKNDKMINNESFSAKFSKSNTCSSSSKLAGYANGKWAYKCSFCNKSFQRIQAFASHRRHCKTPLEDETSVERIRLDPLVKHVQPGIDTICGSVYPFRPTRDRPFEPRSTKLNRSTLWPVINSLEETIHKEVIVQVPKRTCLFDLNEVPPPENDGDTNEGKGQDRTRKGSSSCCLP